MTQNSPAHSLWDKASHIILPNLKEMRMLNFILCLQRKEHESLEETNDYYTLLHSRASHGQQEEFLKMIFRERMDSYIHRAMLLFFCS